MLQDGRHGQAWLSGLDLPSRPGTKHLGNADHGEDFLLRGKAVDFDVPRTSLQLGYMGNGDLALGKQLCRSVFGRRESHR